MARAKAIRKTRMKFLLLLLLPCPPLFADAGLPQASVFEGYTTPAQILAGLCFAESSIRGTVTGDDGISRGWFQFNRKYDRSRSERWGSFDPFSLLDSLRIADAQFQANYRALLMRERIVDPSTWEIRREDMAIAAHRQGLQGVLRDGMGYWYVERVRGCHDLTR